MKLQPDLQLFAIDDDVVVFSAQAQNLLVLNASAASLVRKMMGGASTSEAAGDLVLQGIAPDEAGQWVASMMETLGSYGMLVDVRASIILSATAERNERHLAMLAENLPAYGPGMLSRKSRIAFSTLAPSSALEVWNNCLGRFGHWPFGDG